MTFLYFIIGIIATIIGAVPPGASNLAVVKTTVQENIHQSLKIGYGAGIGEVLLALFALSFGMIVQDFFSMHLWIQYTVVAILGMAGIYFIRSRQKTDKPKRKYGSKYMTGFALSIINPPVLIYWVLVFSILNHRYGFGPNLEIATLLLFFTGVFLGKVVTLYGYGKLGSHLRAKKKSKAGNINKLIGVVLLSIAALQITKLTLF